MLCETSEEINYGNDDGGGISLCGGAVFRYFSGEFTSNDSSRNVSQPTNRPTITLINQSTNHETIKHTIRPSNKQNKQSNKHITLLAGAASPLQLHRRPNLPASRACTGVDSLSINRKNKTLLYPKEALSSNDKNPWSSRKPVGRKMVDDAKERIEPAVPDATGRLRWSSRIMRM